MSTRTYPYTYVDLPVSRRSYDEIVCRLQEAGYVNVQNHGKAIDMHGLALVPEGADEPDSGNSQQAPQ